MHRRAASLFVFSFALSCGVSAQGISITPIPLPYTDTGIVMAPPKAAAVLAPSAPGAWGGPRSGQEATLSDRVANYRINAVLDPVRHTVTGKQRLSWRNRSRSEVRSIYLHLYMNAFKNDHSTFMTELRQRGEALSIGHGEWGSITLERVAQGAAKLSWAYVHPDDGPATDHTVVRVDLATPMAAGATAHFDIDFVTRLPRVIARTGYFDSFHLVAQWFPKIGVLELPGERGATTPRWNVHEFHADSEFYADFGSYDVKLTVPQGYTVGATGVLQGPPQEHQGWLTHHYVQGDVHDFAFTADWRSGPPLQETWTGPDGARVDIKVLYPKEYVASAAPVMRAAKESLAYFGTKLGPYPYRTLTVVVPPYNAQQAGGMEYPTFVTATGHAKVAPGSVAEFDLDDVVIHECGHNYFYGILASNEFEEIMLDEGVNTYWNQRAFEHLKRPARPGWAVLNMLELLGMNGGLKPFDLQRMRAPREEPADPLGQNAWDRLQGIGPVYERGSTMLRDLEQRIGTEAFDRGFKEYYQRWKFRHPSLADLRETLAEASGQRATVERMFAQQVYAVAKVDERIDSFSSNEDFLVQPNAKTAPWFTKVTLRRRGAAVPQTLLVSFADGSSETVVWDNDARWQTFTWLKKSRAVAARLDPQRQHYLDTSKLDDSRTIEPDATASRRWGGDTFAFFNVVLALIASI